MVSPALIPKEAQHLFIFGFVSFTLGDRSRNIATIYVKSVLSTFCFSFMVSGLTFRSLIHLEFIFVYGMRTELLFFMLTLTLVKLLMVHTRIFEWK